ncbi:gliding motility-associated ABC transporter substrate-binding protein GldG [Flavobacterium sp.]|uniref:gliding motility-associated ABC transporter substrate-binding protein GldG n=1 Tax=Flavobacterium sp. TaxID=239 RepID=UPI00333F0E2A
MENKNPNLKNLFTIIFILMVANFAGHYLFKRFDLTEDKRYTLSKSTINIIKQVKEPIYIDVFLEGDFPPEFRRLRNETYHLLDEFKNYNNNIIFYFNNPLEDDELAEQNSKDLIGFGLAPTNINQTIKGKKTVSQIFPWAIASVGTKKVRIPLLVNNFGFTPEDNINKSIQLLEYEISNAISKLTNKNLKKIAVLKGNGEISDKYLADYLINLKENYIIAEFNLDSLKNDLPKTLSNIKRFDAALIAKPTEPFSENEKYILDQYIMNGGKTMWLIDQVSIDLDSLQNPEQTSIAYPLNLNLDDMFFKYGFRINPKLIQDVLSTPITLKSERGDIPIDWLYSPIVKSEENNVINKNLNLVKLEFANQIDTLKNKIKKTVLLKSSKISKTVGTLMPISLNQFMVPLNESDYNNGNQIIGVLLEGKFSSGFKNRVKPNNAYKSIDEGLNSKMIVIADGDIVNYKYVNKKPLINDIDQWTQQVYGNKNFLINSMNYLLDDNGLINIRSKEVDLPILDTQKVVDNYTYSQIVTIGFPITLVLLFGVVFTYLRKKKYSK